MTQQLDGIERDLSQIVAALKNREEQPGHSSTNTIRIEGAGSIWNGIAIGIALGAVAVGTVWTASKMQQMDIQSQQAEAYQKAVYMLAPRFAEEVDKELDRQKERDKK
ncbi:hypothetical protein [Stenotrophomonas sp.]|uniref:hypothetical protein n=1 Tax=Stenotrophomonas sp. TaxID=69392 RepID=UPI0028A042A3|nr:hypothetical protein [Stenotrophomonas sp.]